MVTSCSFSIGIVSTDNGIPPLSFTKYFTIYIDDMNEPATNILVSAALIDSINLNGQRGPFDIFHKAIVS